MRAFIGRLRWVCLISCVAVAAVLLAACGSDEQEADSTPAQPTAAAVTQPTAAPPAPATQPPATAMPEPTAPPSMAATAESAEPSVEVGLDVGQRAPDFTLTSQEGESITRASLEGRPVLLYFYTTW